ncbi:MAG: hypothetical protein L0229_23860 [Blastocatellia bacterium]|nr:hypothetical protein [Blastocatellia bacterium]
MSAKLTIIFFIMICFETGVLLVILPWLNYPSWNENYLLILATENLHAPVLARIMTSGYMRGAVTGLGLLNIMLGAWEIINYNKTVRTFQTEWQVEDGPGQSLETAGISDNRPADASNPDQ